ncbi:hypothetical protein Noc_1953 [Nitrosococcus oceani ATCC 19707]|uniref:Glycosyltransferase RgtA/B/C/D-like domain-containing protein n=2 Tax=Nitrosococcus oceani TaxID=1229 RepID=Q3J9T1_NITOC|nr:hypothetical protein [Nitrosococcus oceani]ABA58415.1 hypothetical protein Noc_1953 [Nitrosococcus oceani ATCC 19707]EDZ67894.1 hypothetical protein NOC27_1221 [Nitrosococcus oceani AFC27]KFI19129.1 hypothetical protein IB75_10425 [Nitrosococcus oceani C-27]GEM18809.1 hypothetical protein NONS58_01700 [Nitrosococcus oceani]
MIKERESILLSERQAVCQGLFWLLGICILVRVFLWIVYAPVIWPDTGTYLQLAGELVRLDFSEYDGTRTPVYPLLLLLAGKNPFGVWFLQSVLGVSASLLLFVLVFEQTRKVSLAFSAGTIHSLALNELLFEANLLTESVSSFLLIFSVFIFSKLLVSERKFWPAVGLGGASSLLALTHPLFAFVGPLYILLAILFFRGRNRICIPLIVLLCFALPVSGWIGFNKITLDYAGITTFMGYNLSNHSGGFIERAPPSKLRDIYLRYREKKVKQSGNHSMTIFEAKGEIMAATGLSHVDLSRKLARLSLQLFVEHPALYLQSVFKSWVSFWVAPNYWKPTKIISPTVAASLERLWWVEQGLIRVMNLLFIFFAAGLIVKVALFQGYAEPALRVPLVITVLIIVTSLVQALFEYGNTRYSIPTQSLMITFILLFGRQIKVHRWLGIVYVRLKSNWFQA